MGLFENLFKPRPDGTLERIVEAPLRASGLVERAATVDGEEAPDPATAFLQPKGYAPGTTGGGASAQSQGFMPVLPSAKRAPAHERRPAPMASATGKVSTVILTVADVLPRIPGAFLRPGPHDLRRELRFQIEDLASDITRGKPVIALSCIAEQCPELFHHPITDEDDMAIRLPLQKLVEQVGNFRAPAAPAPAPFVLPPAKPAVTAPVESLRSGLTTPVTTPAPPMTPVAPPVPVAPAAPIPAPAPPIVTKSVEPVAPAPVVPPSPPPPVIMTPPPVTVSEAVTPVVSEIAPLLAPEPEALKPVAEVVAPVVEAAAPPVVEVPEPEAEAVAPEAKVPAPVVEEEPALVSERPVDRHAFGSMIDLSLAALVAKVPREMLSGDPPRVADGERISLPFPMIERQLGTGSVSVPARVFLDALPPLLRHHFTQREDVTVPVPLEEIFQNLPVGDVPEKIRLDPIAPPPRPAPEVMAPVILTSAVADEATPQLDFDAPLPEPSVPIAEVPDVPMPPIAEPSAVPLGEIPAAPVVEFPVPPIAEVPPLLESAAPTPPEPVPALPREDIVLAATVAAPPEPESLVSATPDEGQPGVIHLQPFRVLHLPTPAVETEAAEAVTDEGPILGAVPGDLSSAPNDAHILQGIGPAPVSEPVAETLPEQSQTSEPSPADEPFLLRPPEPVPAFSVLPSPAPEESPAALPPEAEPLVAFNPDLPPPLRVETPAAAVAVLHASVPPPMKMPAVAMAAGSVQPPPMFRPMVVQPPPISGVASALPVQLAPKLSGPGSIHGMISLSPVAEARPPAIFPAVSAPAPPVPSVPAVAKTLPATPPAPVVPPLPIAPAPMEKPGAPSPISAPLPPAAFTPPKVPAPAAPMPQLAPLAPPAPPVAAPVSVAAPPVVSKPAEPPHLHLSPLATAPASAPPAVEHAPPSIPISRFDQHSLQSLFMTEEMLDIPRIARLAAALPGIQACVIATRGETHSSGALPEGFQLSALRGLSPQVDAAADRLPIGQIKNFTLYGEQYSISFFERTAVCLCAIHRARSFVPGVREKLVAVVDELARG